MTYADLEREFERLPPYGALVTFIREFGDLRKKYMLRDLMAYMRKLKDELTDEDIYRFYEEYPEHKGDFVSIASLLISWVPLPPKETTEVRLPLDSNVWEAIREQGLGLAHVGAFYVVPDDYVLLKFRPGIRKELIDRVASAVRTLGYRVRVRREVVRFW